MSTTMPAIPASTMLAVTKNAMPPTAPPVTRAPSLLPKMLLAIAPPIGMANSRKNSRLCQSKPKSSGLNPPCAEVDGAGKFSAPIRLSSASIVASMPCAYWPALSAGAREVLMICLAAKSGIAPSKDLATSMRSLRSSLAMMISTPSPTSRRPIFHALATRLA